MSENIDIITRKENIVAIADAVRAKNGTTAEMTLGEIVSGIEGIEAGGGGFPNGTEWTITNGKGGTATADEIKYFNGKYYSYYGDGNIYISNDGKIWEHRSLPKSFKKIVIKDGYFIGICTHSNTTTTGITTLYHEIYISIDGEAWTLVCEKAFSHFVQDVISIINNILFVGNRYYSYNYYDWFDCGDYKYIIGYYNGLWYSSYDSSTNPDGLWYSSDLKSWTQSNITTGAVRQLSFEKGLFVASSSSGLYYSTDGKTWTQSNITSPVSALYYANGLWVSAVGNSGVCYSTDGKTWISNTTLRRPMVFKNEKNIWVAGSIRYGLYYSTDGKTWTQSNITNVDDNEIKLFFINGLWLATIAYEGCYYSVDGKTWVQMAGLTHWIKHITDINGILFAVQGDNTIAYSISWEPTA